MCHYGIRVKQRCIFSPLNHGVCRKPINKGLKLHFFRKEMMEYDNMALLFFCKFFPRLTLYYKVFALPCWNFHKVVPGAASSKKGFGKCKGFVRIRSEVIVWAFA